MRGKQPVITVAARPARPVLIYDGGCNFCKFWILRWQQNTRERVEYVASQEPQAGKRFPEIPRERFEESVQLVETDGRVYGGAEAVFRVLKYGGLGGMFSWLYEHIPGFAPVAEGAYRFVARRRTAFSFLTRLFWGRSGALPSYRLSGWVFLRFLGIIYLCAFASLGTQVVGLVGKNGILPATLLMTSAREHYDKAKIKLERYHELPTLCWFGTSDGFLRTLCGAGCLLSVLLIVGIAPAPCLFLMWLIYLSLAAICREFLGFQWDVLLLETGWLAIFFAPLQLWPRWLKFRRGGIPLIPPFSPNGGEGAGTPVDLKANLEPPQVMRWLLWWLLFRLMYESGVVKLTSGDPTWRHLLALNYHYQTQPLPTWVGWYAHQLPESFQKFCVLVMFGIELVAPFFIFLARRLRLVGCWLLIFLQVVILLTGNYCFFNWLTIALCLLLLDDAALQKLVPKKWRGQSGNEKILLETAKPTGGTMGEITVPAAPIFPERCRWRWPWWVTLPQALLILMLTIPQVWGTLHGVRRNGWPKKIAEWVQPFSSVNSYGLFAVMTTERPEIVVEGSNDGQTWKEYEFKYKPGDLKGRPGFVAPHQPRLDWQMWFAALGNYQHNPWFVNFCVRLLEGSPEVASLMAKNPFPDAPPRYIRARLYDYRFSDFQQQRADGVWWRREYRGEYLPSISLKENR